MRNTAFAFGLGVGTHSKQGEWLEIFFPQPLLHPSIELLEALSAINYDGGNRTIDLSSGQLDKLADKLTAAGAYEQANIANSFKSTKKPLVAVVLAEDLGPSTVAECYLKLHLISHRLVKPHGTILEGLFGILPNVAWTNHGAIAIAELAERQLQARLNGDIIDVASIDKFPKMTNYVVPKGVRIAHTARVRLGAYLGEGTTIMHEGFVNFNAGTAGPGMIEGRISAGVFVDKGSDLGGSSSTMGTLSGGGNIIISVGKECLLGANAGIGIPLGDRCTVEAGLYITAGTKLLLLDNNGNVVKTTKARDLAGKCDLLFRRNSVSGSIECLSNRSAIELNKELHANN